MYSKLDTITEEKYKEVDDLANKYCSPKGEDVINPAFDALFLILGGSFIASGYRGISKKYEE